MVDFGTIEEVDVALLEYPFLDMLGCVVMNGKIKRKTLFSVFTGTRLWWYLILFVEDHWFFFRLFLRRFCHITCILVPGFIILAFESGLVGASRAAIQVRFSGSRRGNPGFLGRSTSTFAFARRSGFCLRLALLPLPR